MYTEKPWKIEILSPSGTESRYVCCQYNKDKVSNGTKVKKVCLWHLINDDSFLGFMFLTCDTSLNSVALWELGGGEQRKLL